MKKILVTVIAIIVLVIVLVGVLFGEQIKIRFVEGTEYADLQSYFKLESDEQGAIILDRVILSEKAVVSDGVFYLDLTTIQTYLHNRFYYSSTDGEIRYSDATSIYAAYLDGAAWTELTAGVTSEYEESYTIAYVQDDTCYIAIDFVAKFVDMSVAYATDPDRVVIQTDFDAQAEVVTVAKDTSVRWFAGLQSDILSDIYSGDMLYLMAEQDVEDWTKVITYDGYIGYVRDKYLEDDVSVAVFDRVTAEFPESEFTSISFEDPIALGFQAVYSMAGNDELTSLARTAYSMNVVSPTWFAVCDDVGNITSLASKSYVDTAHSLGLQVWGLVNDFEYDIDMYAILSSAENRTRLINNIIAQVEATGMDGINIDFELISSAAGVHYVQFMRELGIVCREKGIVLSVDKYPSNSGNTYYDYVELGIVTDYVILMGYDEHWGGSGDPGSTASSSFVMQSIDNIIALIDKDKVINALPFYTRFWSIASDGTVTDQAITMINTDTVVANNNMTVTWDDETGQNYAEVTTSSGTIHKMWIEDVTSLQNKLESVVDREIAGVAAWRLGYENQGAWDLIQIFLDKLK
ncbi:MAG: glycosyl hydrolase family 18 protein [Lachnospiraceae bacterium]